MHDLTALFTLAGALAVALLLGWITDRLGLSTLVGYLLAGIAVGPYTPGFVADPRVASQMAEIGVVLLMFGVGMHFHPRDLLRVWRIAVPGAFAQSAIALLVGWAGARLLGWSHGAGIVFGMALAVASTVVLMRMLLQQGRLATRHGHVAVGWLIVEDLFTIAALVVLPALAAAASLERTASAVGLALAKAGAFGGLAWVVGSRLLDPVMERIAGTRSTELFTLAIFVAALGVAVVAAELFSVSVALGAFLGGLVVGNSRFGPQAAADMAPFRDVFTALFFVSIGMLVNPAYVFGAPWPFAIALAIVLLVKPLVALGIVLLLRDTVRTAITVSVGLAQIGEFSFILAAVGTSVGILPQEGMDALVAAALVSIALNPLLFRLAARFEPPASLPSPGPAEEMQGPARVVADDALVPVVLISGSGELCAELARRCEQAGARSCVIDKELPYLDQLQAQGIATVFGDPARPEVLAAAGIAQARVLVLAQASLPEKLAACIAARQQNRRIAIIALVGGRAERAWLQEVGASITFDMRDELADSLMRSISGQL